MKYQIVIATALLVTASMSYAKENTAPDAQAVNSACSSDAATAGCGGDKVGTGLLKCLHAYKKSHKEFKFSDGCKSAMKTLHHDRKEMREKEEKEEKKS